MMIKYHDILGVSLEAKIPQIKAAERGLLILYGEKTPANILKREKIREAVAVLCDPQRREAYKQELKREQNDILQEAQLLKELAVTHWKSLSYEEPLHRSSDRDFLYTNQAWRDTWSRAANDVLKQHPELLRFDLVQTETARVIVLGLECVKKSSIWQLTETMEYDGMELISFLTRKDGELKITLQDMLRQSRSRVDDPTIAPMLIRWAQIFARTHPNEGEYQQAQKKFERFMSYTR